MVYAMGNEKAQKITVENILGNGIVNIIERNGISFTNVDDLCRSDLKWTSPEGEAVSFSVSVKSPSAFVTDFAKYASSFNIEEYAAEWYNSHSADDISYPLDTLLKEALEIKEHLLIVAEKLINEIR